MKFELLISQEAKKFLESKLGTDNAIQLRIKTNGCAGYSYDLQYVPKNESQICFSGINFDILDKDKQDLNLSIIKLKKEGLSSKISIENPNSFNECGCGESFSLKK